MSELLMQIGLGFVGSGLPRLVNFLLFAAVLYYLLRDPARDFFRRRAQQIRRELEEAEQMREAAARALGEVRARLAQVDQEVAEIAARAAAEAEAEYERLQRQTQDELEKIRALAEREIEAARRAAELEVRAFVIARVVERARHLLRHHLTEEDHRRLIAEFIEELAEVPR